MLGSTHAYTGPTTVSIGILLVNTTLSNTGSVSIASGAKLGGSGSVGGTVNHNQPGAIINPGVVGGASAGTITFTGPLTLNGGTVQYDVDGSQLGVPSAQDLVKAMGGLSIVGSTPIDLEFLDPSSPPSSPYDFTLFNYTGAAVTAGQAANLSFISNLPGRSTYTVNVATPGVVSVHVVPGLSANLRWNSASSGVWDVNTTANWFNLGTSSVDKYQSGDNVTFADGSFQTNITLNSTASNSAVNVTSNTNNYTISGTGKISGNSTLSMSGASTLTIKTNNDYVGNTTISGGTVDVGGSGTSGRSDRAIFITTAI